MADIENADGCLPAMTGHQRQGRGDQNAEGDCQQYDDCVQLHKHHYIDTESTVNVKL